MAQIDVYNQALSAIGTKSKFATIADAGVEIETCNLWFQPVRDLVLSAAPWSAAKATAKLVVAVERDTAADWVATDPPPGWLFSYTLPADIARPRYLSQFGRFELGVSSANVKQLFTNEEDAILIYTKRQTDTTLWDHDLTMAIIYALAAHMCMKLTGKHERGKILEERANEFIMNARLNDANSQDVMVDTIVPWHAARGAASLEGSRYIFPSGPAVNVGWF